MKLSDIRQSLEILCQNNLLWKRADALFQELIQLESSISDIKDPNEKAQIASLIKKIKNRFPKILKISHDEIKTQLLQILLQKCNETVSGSIEDCFRPAITFAKMVLNSGFQPFTVEINKLIKQKKKLATNDIFHFFYEKIKFNQYILTGDNCVIAYNWTAIQKLLINFILDNPPYNAAWIEHDYLYQIPIEFKINLYQELLIQLQINDIQLLKKINQEIDCFDHRHVDLLLSKDTILGTLFQTALDQELLEIQHIFTKPKNMLLPLQSYLTHSSFHLLFQLSDGELLSLANQNETIVLLTSQLTFLKHLTYEKPFPLLILMTLRILVDQNKIDELADYIINLDQNTGIDIFELLINQIRLTPQAFSHLLTFLPLYFFRKETLVLYLIKNIDAIAVAWQSILTSALLSQHKIILDAIFSSPEVMRQLNTEIKKIVPHYAKEINPLETYLKNTSPFCEFYHLYLLHLSTDNAKGFIINFHINKNQFEKITNSKLKNFVLDAIKFESIVVLEFCIYNRNFKVDDETLIAGTKQSNPEVFLTLLNQCPRLSEKISLICLTQILNNPNTCFISIFINAEKTAWDKLSIDPLIKILIASKVETRKLFLNALFLYSFKRQCELGKQSFPVNFFQSTISGEQHHNAINWLMEKLAEKDYIEFDKSQEFYQQLQQLHHYKKFLPLLDTLSKNTIIDESEFEMVPLF